MKRNWGEKFIINLESMQCEVKEMLKALCI